MEQANKFWRYLKDPAKTILLASAHSGISAKLVEEAGFDGIWASGLEISTFHFIWSAGREHFVNVGTFGYCKPDGQSG